MNSDPGAAGREGGMLLWLWLVSQHTFWRVLDPAREIFGGGPGRLYRGYGDLVVGGCWNG